ncbi:hypothetical protein [Nocardioides sp. SR21]|uniref:hypothetical protein n=1 Tax=Nocardioides sp. SR21 TaxID=2919501 RepID=UPI001FAA0FDC|nr:hypothetical protein [Nocardioides sp. SR21]
MPSTRPSLRALVALSLLTAALAGCSGDEPEATPPAPPPDAAKAITRSLDARVEAVRDADADAFAKVVGGGGRFRDAQQTWFTNLTQLPIERLRYRIDPASLVRDGDAYAVTADLTLQLEGYDAAPVTTPARLRFRPDPRHPARFLLTDVEQSDPQPWDLGPVQVREGAGVLGVFDAGSVDEAPDLLDSVESGIASVAAEVPYDWSGSVVVYALSDPEFLLGLEDVPGDQPGDLDAVAFPVGESTRVALNPRMLDQTGRERDRLVRHELTHVAVGAHDDTAPVWLSEGLAEYVAVRPLAPEDRRIPEVALQAAETGDGDLPDDDSFNDEDSEAHYGLAWWAVEYIADAYGPSAPWQLLDAMAEPDADPDRVLRAQLGLTTDELAGQADRMILALYDRS